MKTHVVIIGAGPAGLAAAVSLTKRGISCALLERGGTAAAGLRRVDPAMKLFSPARLSRLPGMRLYVGKPAYPTFGQFLDALDAYRTEHAIEVITGAEVTRAERTSEGFLVHARVGAEARSLPASHVINATGIVSTPKLPPDFDPAAS
ncbi:MAG TPA: NAD(P)-binding domain-containing protein, partial [Polyangia bacterium]|nr:NAD(P)-binding domain-containing protein [Polyangia bacterium]